MLPRCAELVRRCCAGSSRRDDGVATVWGVAWIVVTSTFGWLAVMATVVVSAQHRLDAAADLAAISAAARFQHGGEACVLAGVVARDNDAVLAGCRLEGGDVVVTVTASIDLPFGVDGAMTSTARAGP